MSGQLGVADGALVHGGVADETRQALANEAYIEAFGDHRPARAAVAVAGIPLDALVEIEAWAYLPTEA